MALCKEIPEAFMAVNSMNSPKFPKVIKDESSTARGNANETIVAETNINSLPIIIHSNPLPTRSSTYFQTNCMSRIKREIKNVSTKGPK